MKATKITYWVSTVLIVLFILPGIFLMNSPQALEGMHHLGLPNWFRLELSYGKIIGGFILIVPFLGRRIKEWAYVALGIDFISAFIANTTTDGFTAKGSLPPIVTLVILIVSYLTYHKLKPSFESN